MRLLKLGVYHPTYLQNFFTSNSELGTQSYSSHHAALIGDCFGSSDFWTNALSKLGYETIDIIANAEMLQRRWAFENGLPVSDNNWLFDIAGAQIRDFGPDVLLVADYTTFTADFLRQLKSNNSSIKLIVGWCGAPYEDLSVLREWDIALSCVPELVSEFRSDGLNAFHVNHAFDPRLLQKLNGKTQPTIDFAFFGSIVKQQRFHIERERLLLYLIEHTNLQICSDVPALAFAEREHSSITRELFETVSAGGKKLSARFLDRIPFLRRLTKPQGKSENNVDVEIARRVRPPLFGIDMFRRLRDTRVIFNNHLDISKKNASNMRLFETTGMGTCLLTDSKENLPQLFEPDKEVLTYRSAEECVEKVRYILDHEDERRSIAAAGQVRTLRDHNFEDRASRIDEIIRGALAA